MLPSWLNQKRPSDLFLPHGLCASHPFGVQIDQGKSCQTSRNGTAMSLPAPVSVQRKYHIVISCKDKLLYSRETCVKRQRSFLKQNNITVMTFRFLSLMSHLMKSLMSYQSTVFPRFHYKVDDGWPRIAFSESTSANPHFWIMDCW